MELRDFSMNNRVYNYISVINIYSMRFFKFLIVSLLLPFTLKAQTVFHDASQFPLFGKISNATETHYERLPAKLKNVSRPPVWSLGKNTAGLAIRFCSDSHQISARWEVLICILKSII